MSRKRARELGIVLGALPTGERDGITDVAGVRVGHSTLVAGDAVRTGVTVVLPDEEPLFAGAHRLNGNGELTGLEWVRESGMLTTPVGLTNTHSVGVVRDAIVAAGREARSGSDAWSLPVVGETWDGLLNDIEGMYVRPEHLVSALADASDTAVVEGNVGGGTGMICHGFKGGIGTSSRVVEEADGAVVGVLVQANYGRRERLRTTASPSARRSPSPTCLLPHRPTAPPAARSSRSSPRTRRCSPASASGSPSAPASASGAWAAWGRTRAAISSSPSPRGTQGSASEQALWLSACSRTSA